MKSNFKQLTTVNCNRVKCPHGYSCMINSEGRPMCLTKRASCHRRRDKSICGDNGKTYKNRCELHNDDIKEGRVILIAYQGDCKGHY